MSILAKVNPSTTVGTVIYTAPVGRKPLVNINVANVSNADADFIIGLVQNADKSILSIGVVSGGEYTSKPTIVIAGSNTSAASASVITLAAKNSAIVAAGSGYTVGDTLTIVSGESTIPAAVTVATVNGAGAILTITLTNIGNYTVLPAGNLTVTGGTGTAATFTLTWKILTVTVSAGGNGYNPTTVVVSANDVAVTAAVFSTEYTTVFEPMTDSYHPLTRLNSSGVIERTGITLSAGDSVIAMSSIPGAINFIVLGYEDVA